MEDTTQLGLQVFGVGEAETSFRLLITLPVFLERARQDSNLRARRWYPPACYEDVCDLERAIWVYWCRSPPAGRSITSLNSSRLHRRFRPS